jgi:hypothetical protein
MYISSMDVNESHSLVRVIIPRFYGQDETFI